MAQYFNIHPDNPNTRLIKQAVAIIQKGGVIAYPTDSCYALGCHIGDKEAMERLRQIRRVDERHHLTLVCANLSQAGSLARIDDFKFRLIRANTPGSYTFILEATKEVPRRLLHPRHTIGIRIPDHPVAIALLEELGEPILSSTLILPDQKIALADPEEIRDHLEKRLDLIIDAGLCGVDMTTVIDLSEPQPRLLRAGKGDPRPFGFDAGALH